MGKKLKKILALGLVAAALSARASRAAYTISVEPFRNATPYRIPADTVTEMMVTELVNSGMFQVVERDRIGAIAREQRLTQGGAAEEGPRAGRLAGAQYIMTGAVTRYEHTGVGGGAGGRVGGHRHGFIGGLIASSTAYVTLDVRIADAATSAIVYAGRAEGAGTSVMLGILSRYGGFGTGRGGGLMATAAHKAVTKVIDNLRRAVGAGAAPGGGDGNYVLENRGDVVTIDAGTGGGAKRKQYYAVYREGEPIRDLHGNVLDTERRYIAVIQVIDARPQYSNCRIARGGGVRRGDAIEPVRKPNQVRLYGEN